jgi:cyclic lactone autoinducer peptide
MGKKLFIQFGKVVNMFALLMVFQSANSTCVWVFHQPKFPDDAEKYIK